MHTNKASQKPNLSGMTTGESDAGASMVLVLQCVNGPTVSMTMYMTC